MSDEKLVFNGINGATGGYLLPEMTPQQISKIAQGEPLDPENLAELKWRHQQASAAHLGLAEGVNPKDLAASGWGIVFAFDDKDLIDGIKEALKPLLELRQRQAGGLYREYVGPAAVRPGESKNKWLARHGAGPGK